MSTMNKFEENNTGGREIREKAATVNHLKNTVTWTRTIVIKIEKSKWNRKKKKKVAERINRT